jgi:hypothetical protein
MNQTNARLLLLKLDNGGVFYGSMQTSVHTTYIGFGTLCNAGKCYVYEKLCFHQVLDQIVFENTE